MLPAASKLRRSQHFAAAVRRGRRGGARHLMVHLLLTEEPRPPRAGFVVSGKVGNSVVRHRITRQLRPLVRDRLTTLPAGADLVIRVLPPGATATSTELAADLDSGLMAATGSKARR